MFTPALTTHRDKHVCPLQKTLLSHLPPHGSFMKLHRANSLDVQRGTWDPLSRVIPTDSGIKIQKHQYFKLRSKSASRLRDGGGPFTLQRVMWCRTCECFRGPPTCAFTERLWRNDRFYGGCTAEEKVRKGQSGASLAAYALFWN